MVKIKTFQEWLDQSIYAKEDPNPKLLEDGYAWYLEQILGRTPTRAEIKKYGKIKYLIDEYWDYVKELEKRR